MKTPHTEYVVNTNTNLIFRYVDNELYILKAEKPERKNYQTRKRTYCRVKVDQSIDYKKQFPSSRVRKYISQGYFIECKNYNQALYHQY